MTEIEPLTRRILLQRAGAGAAIFALPAFLAACGDDETEPASATAADPTSDLDVSPGGDIPTVPVKFGMAPFPDATFYVIAMKRGWFDEVGIQIQPAPTGSKVTPDNVVQKMVTGEAEITTFYGPGKIANQAKAPDIKMFGFSDSFTGNFLLAAPDSGAERVSELVAGGMEFEAALTQALAPLKGEPLIITNTGQRRDFIEGIFSIGGLSFDDVEIEATNDARILQLAKGGRTKYASPEGAAQNIELLGDGWFPIVGADDLLRGLPPGDPRSVASIGHEGPACSQEYLDENRETCLRFLSVMFRTIDAILEEGQGALKDQAPYVTSVAGVETTAADLEAAFERINPLVKFEDQTQYWVDLDDPRSYVSVYGAQIASAKRAGIIPSNLDVKPQDAIVGESLYKQLVALKGAYDDMLGDAGDLSGAAKTMADDAAAQYAARNYLDAYRMLKTAVGTT